MLYFGKSSPHVVAARHVDDTVAGVFPGGAHGLDAVDEGERRSDPWA